MRRTCRSSTAGSRSSPRAADVQQLVVGDAAPQEERQPRRQLEIADAIRRAAARRRPGRCSTRNRNCGLTSTARQRHLDAGVEVRLRAAPRDRARAGPREVRVGRPAAGRPGASACARICFARRAPRRPADVGRDTKMRRRLGVSPGAVGAERAGDRDRVDRRLNPRMPVRVEVRLVRLARAFRAAATASSGTSRRGRAGRPATGSPDLQVRDRRWRGSTSPCGGFTVNSLHALAVEQHLELVRLAAGPRRARCGRGSGGSGSRTRRPAGTCSGRRAPPRVPTGRPSTWSSCVRSGGHADRVAAGRAARTADRQPADLLAPPRCSGRAASARDRRPSRCRSRSSTRRPAAATATSMSSASRSRMAFWYSVRVSRRIVAVRPGFGRAAAARSSDGLEVARRPRRRSRRPAASCPTGGICRARSLRTTFSQTSGCRATCAPRIDSSASPPFSGRRRGRRGSTRRRRRGVAERRKSRRPPGANPGPAPARTTPSRLPPAAMPLPPKWLPRPAAPQAYARHHTRRGGRVEPAGSPRPNPFAILTASTLPVPLFRAQGPRFGDERANPLVVQWAR